MIREIISKAYREIMVLPVRQVPGPPFTNMV